MISYVRKTALSDNEFKARMSHKVKSNCFKIKSIQHRRCMTKDYFADIIRRYIAMSGRFPDVDYKEYDAYDDLIKLDGTRPTEGSGAMTLKGDSVDPNATKTTLDGKTKI